MIRFKSNAEVPPCLSVVVPVFNEGATIAQVLEQVLEQRPVLEVVVDDASRDNSWEVMQRFAGHGRVKLFRHDRNQGKGAALRTGFARATAPYVLVQDADLEYDPSEYHLLLEPVQEGGADVEVG